MSYFDDASLAFLPSGAAGKDGKAYSIKPTDGTGDFTFSRGSNLAATRVNAAGLIEKGRENRFTQSNNFSTSPWTSSGTTETSGQSGYDGTSDAWLLNAASAGGYLYRGASSSLSGLSTVSIYAKKGTADGVRLRLPASGSTDANVYINLIDGSDAASATGVISHTVTSLGTGWYRIQMTFNVTSPVDFRIFPANSSGSVVAGTIYIQDTQSEIGLAATAVIETTTTTVTAGILEDTPRFDYSNGASCPSLLLEVSRTNLIPKSEYVGSMNLQNVSATANATTSPEGVGNAYEVEPTGTGFKTIRNSVTVTANSKYTISFFYKNIDHKNIGFYDNNTAGSEIQINVQNNTFTLGSACVAGDIEDYGNGWYRAWCTFPVSSGTLANYLIFRSETNNGSYTATGSSIYVYGFQIEQGSYQTSYIPTNGTSQSRAAEVCVTGTPSTTLFGQTEGTVFCEYTPVSDDTTNISRFFRLSNSGNSNQIYMQHEASNKITAVVFNGSNQFVGQTSTGYVSVGNTYKFALAYKNGDYAFYANGVQIAVGTATGLGTLAVDRLGLTNANINKSSKVKQGIVFKTRLTNNDLSDLTNPYKSYSEFVTTFGFTWESQDCTNNSIAVLKN